MSPLPYTLRNQAKSGRKRPEDASSDYRERFEEPTTCTSILTKRRFGGVFPQNPLVFVNDNKCGEIGYRWDIQADPNIYPVDSSVAFLYVPMSTSLSWATQSIPSTLSSPQEERRGEERRGEERRGEMCNYYSSSDVSCCLLKFRGSEPFQSVHILLRQLEAIQQY